MACVLLFAIFRYLNNTEFTPCLLNVIAEGPSIQSSIINDKYISRNRGRVGEFSSIPPASHYHCAYSRRWWHSFSGPARMFLVDKKGVYFLRDSYVASGLYYALWLVARSLSVSSLYLATAAAALRRMSTLVFCLLLYLYLYCASDLARVALKSRLTGLKWCH